MFADERPHLRALPVEPFRYYEYGMRVVHMDGCVEVEGAYYHAPPGWLGQSLKVQWDGLRVRLLHPVSEETLREYAVQRHGGGRVLEQDRPKKTPRTTLQLLGELTRAGKHVAALADGLRKKHGDEDVTPTPLAGFDVPAGLGSVDAPSRLAGFGGRRFRGPRTRMPAALR